MEQNTQISPNLEEFSKKFQELLKEYNVIPNISLDFPDYKNLPAEVQLALLVMNKHKNQFVLGFKENK